MAFKLLVSIFVTLLLYSPLYGEKPSSLLHKKAPIISGKNSQGNGLLNLRKLMQKLDRARDENGKYIEKNGKYVWKFQKNVVVLNFFSTSCIPCIREIPSYNKIAEAYADKPVKLIYVNVDVEVPLPKLKRFIIKKEIKVPMMLPNQRDVIKKYQVYSLPRIVIIDLNQNVSNVIVGFQADIEHQLVGIIDGLLDEK